MERPMCKTCPYFWYEGYEDDGSVGECRRHAPRPLLTRLADTENFDIDNTLFYVVAFPQIHSQKLEWDFCGEHPAFPAYIASLNSPSS